MRNRLPLEVSFAFLPDALEENEITTVKEVWNIFSQNFKANIFTCNKMIALNFVAGLYSKLLSNINPF